MKSCSHSNFSQFSTNINQLDLEQPRNEHFFNLPTVVTKWIITNLLKGQEENNIFILLVTINILLTSLPLAIALYVLESTVNNFLVLIFGAAYFLFHILIYARSFILALHYSTHTPIFKKKWRFLKYINNLFLCSLFGIPPGLYYCHHIAMHHCHNNTTPLDLSSTMPYQRDSKWQHFQYMLRFALAIWVELPYILFLKKCYKMMLGCILGESIFWAVIFYLFTQSPIATFFVFILPTAVISFAMMQGNWKQHIFVDPDEPTNFYKSTFTCINTPTNQGNFNDGYHIEHHKNPAIPWHRLPKYFLSNLNDYAENDGFIFTGIGSMEVGSLVLNGQLNELADHYL
ncbi:MAG: fatty acid desaturase, partial [Moorea sp. SIO2B7]|nr:fatty acid desaturase [Moorena sp. SIO2B7]